MARTQLWKFKVISLDVWGHGPDEHGKYDCDGECEGYTVNAAYYTGRTIEVIAHEKIYNEGTPQEFRSFDATSESIIRACVEEGMLTPPCAEKDAVEVDGEDDGTLYLEDAESGMPLLHLERVPCTCGFDEKPSYSAHEHHASCEIRKS